MTYTEDLDPGPFPEPPAEVPAPPSEDFAEALRRASSNRRDFTLILCAMPLVALVGTLTGTVHDLIAPYLLVCLFAGSQVLILAKALREESPGLIRLAAFFQCLAWLAAAIGTLIAGLVWLVVGGMLTLWGASETGGDSSTLSWALVGAMILAFFSVSVYLFLKGLKLWRLAQDAR